MKNKNLEKIYKYDESNRNMKKRKESSFFNKNENCKFAKSNLLLVIFLFGIIQNNN